MPKTKIYDKMYVIESIRGSREKGGVDYYGCFECSDEGLGLAEEWKREIERRNPKMSFDIKEK